VDELVNVLKMLAPGTSVREGLENIVRAKAGALIVVAHGPEVEAVLDGGFAINIDFNPHYLYELAKMDGAIVVDDGFAHILRVNTLLMPDAGIFSPETGSRHRAADRTARQTGALIVAISERRGLITIYKGETRYILKDVPIILTKANQALQTMEKYRSVLDQSLNSLSILEFEDLVTLSDVVTAIQRAEMLNRVSSEIERYVIELGNEGRLVNMQMEELNAGTADEENLILRDYIQDEDVASIRQALQERSSADLLDTVGIGKALGFVGMSASLDLPVSPRGYRLLSKIPRLPFQLPGHVIDNLVKSFGTLQGIVEASLDDLDKVEGVGEVRAHMIKDGLKRLREEVFLGRRG
jgi:diadenylate cyclase